MNEVYRLVMSQLQLSPPWRVTLPRVFVEEGSLWEALSWSQSDAKEKYVSGADPREQVLRKYTTVSQ